MRAFLVAVRAAIGYYNDLFVLFGLSLLWWATGGIFLVAAIVLAIPLVASDASGPWWLTPLLSIPAGPAMAALALIARRSGRQVRFDRTFYIDALRAYWRPALIISAVGGVVLALLLLNVIFYFNQANPTLRILSLLWVYLIVVWLAIQLYAYAVLVALEKPTALMALRTAAISAFANPLFSAVLVLIVLALTALSTVLAIPLFVAWPALLALLGEHAFRVLLTRAGMDPDKGEA